MPDTKAHQFDPTRERLARMAMDQAEIGDDDLCCEPSAGTGGRAEFMPKERTTCVEVSSLHCKVLTANGSNAASCAYACGAVSRCRSRTSALGTQLPMIGKT
jgi:hypothetical protein